MGRPAKPYVLHQLQGTDHAAVRRRMESTPQLPPGIGDPPTYLDAEARKEWRHLASDANYSLVLAHADRGAVIEYCVLYSRMIADARGGKAMGATQRQTLHSLRMQLGLTPVSRTKIHTPPQPKPDNPWAKI